MAHKLTILVSADETQDSLFDFVEDQMIVTINEFQVQAGGVVTFDTEIDMSFSDAVDFSRQLQDAYNDLYLKRWIAMRSRLSGTVK